jgi:3-(3-hydroxy-phenyl)propionate hydroxylase
MTNDNVLIVGAGPVGLAAAAELVNAGIDVTVLEAGEKLSTESRASTFHPPTLDMLDRLGAAKPLIAQGLIASSLQYRTHGKGVIAQFDFGDVADLTAHPYRVQSEQFKLTRILLDHLQQKPNFRIEFGAEVEGVEQDAHGVSARVQVNGKTDVRTGAWLLGADGARSKVRRSLDIEFEGFTWPERFLVLSTPYDFKTRFPDLVSVNYVAAPQDWYFLLKIPNMWRVMFPVDAGVSDETAVLPEFGQTQLARIIEGERFEIAHSTLYRVHQRVAKTFRSGRAFIAGDAAHINNPLGGMGMNGGIHDALNFAEKLLAVIGGKTDEKELDRYDLQRRQVTIEVVQRQTIQNKKDLEAKTEADQAEFRDRLRRIAADRAESRQYLERVGMIASLRRAAEIA